MPLSHHWKPLFLELQEDPLSIRAETISTDSPDSVQILEVEFYGLVYMAVPFPPTRLTFRVQTLESVETYL